MIAFSGNPMTRKDNNLGGLIELTNKVIYNNYNRDLHEILKPESLCLTRVDCSKGLLSLGLAFWEYFFDLSQGLKMSFRRVNPDSGIWDIFARGMSGIWKNHGIRTPKV